MIGDAFLPMIPEARSCTVILTSRSLRPLSESSVRPAVSHRAQRDMQTCIPCNILDLLACSATKTTKRGTSSWPTTTPPTPTWSSHLQLTPHRMHAPTRGQALICPPSYRRASPTTAGHLSSFNVSSSSILVGIGCSKRGGNPTLAPISIALELCFTIGSSGVYAVSNSLSILRVFTIPRQLFVCRPSGKEAHLTKISPAPARYDLGLSC